MIPLRPPTGRLGRVVTVCSDLTVRARRRWSADDTLGRPTISVGNLAFGGRGKTPIAAAFAAYALERGLRPAVLIRGHGGRTRASDEPTVARGLHSLEPTWRAPVEVSGDRRPAHRWAAMLGDEAPWIAASAPGALVVVHPDRGRAGASVRDAVDLFILDDGAQVPVARDVDVLCVQPRHDPPWSAWPEAQRESPRRLAGAEHIVAIVDPSTADSDARVSGVSDVLRRLPGVIRTLDGTPVPGTPEEVVLLCGVGDPGSVEAVARAAGIRRVHSWPLVDHASPGARRLRAALAQGVPVLTTEKDAVRWAAAAHAGSSIIVLSQRLEGVDGLWDRVRAGLRLC